MLHLLSVALSMIAYTCMLPTFVMVLLLSICNMAGREQRNMSKLAHPDMTPFSITQVQFNPSLCRNVSYVDGGSRRQRRHYCSFANSSRCGTGGYLDREGCRDGVRWRSRVVGGTCGCG
eukprot:TRINITY_DN3350_c0_g4_i2.p1 TRINITY_DN3350_c0_g4~~TRINITY_DN3350_c0_g4_i2.p1  ORF type:complete len:119 (+),score=6.28 TRINITY_DN3350_c0_g4_i2:134-490(+)